MRNEAQFLEESLKENGVTVDNIIKERDDSTYVDRFTVIKEVGDEQYTYQTGITDEARVANDPKKLLAMHADSISKEFQNLIVETFNFDGRHIEVSPYDEPWAECAICGNRVELSEQTMTPFITDAELTTPQPVPQDLQSMVNELSEQKRILLELYLLGELRTSCDDSCPNARFSDRKI